MNSVHRQISAAIVPPGVVHRPHGLGDRADGTVGSCHVFDPVQECFKLRSEIHNYSAEFFSNNNPPGDGTVPMDASCTCSLQLDKLIPRQPSPPLPLSLCEYHELLLSLPPRLQNNPWEIAYDTARDGCSLNNFYRAMEELYAKGKCGIGIFLVAARTDGNPHEDGARSLRPRVHNVHENNNDDKKNASTIASTSSSRVAAIGCFTPEVPCLERRHITGGSAQKGYYGSSDTFVMRVSRSGRRPFGATQAKVAASATMSDSSPLTDETNKRRDVSIFSMMESDQLMLPTRRKSQSTPHDASAQLVFPSVSETSEVLESPSEGCSSRMAASPVTKTHGLRRGDDHDDDDKEEERQPRLQQPKLIEKYSWSGDANNRRFVFANASCFGIGGGRDGAAIFVDGDLQYGTSSVHCPTFDSPALVHTDRSNGGGGGLPHVEFEILRMLWFSVAEKRGSFTNMTSLDSQKRCHCGRKRRSQSLHGEAGRDDDNQFPIHTCATGYFSF